MEDSSDELLSRLQPFLIEWVRRLYLETWEIILKIDNDIESWACVGVCVPMHSATIHIRNPNTAPSDWDHVSGDDVEQTLVHELLHIVNAGFEKTLRKIPKKFGVFDQYESSLELTARALVAAKRGKAKV